MSLSNRARALSPYVVMLIQNTSTSDNPIKSKVIEQKYNLSGEIVREIVRNARRNGVPIASDSNGYFYAASQKELKETLDQLRNRAKSILKTINALESVYPNKEQNELF